MDTFLSQTIINSNPNCCVLLKPPDFKCGDGWFRLLNEMCSLTELCLKEEPESRIKFLTFFEKFGILEVDFLGGNYITNNIISFTKVLSYKTCEKCGERGSFYSATGNEFGKYATLCFKDAIKLGYKKI